VLVCRIDESRKTLELLVENLLRERRNRLMISKSTIRGKRSTGKIKEIYVGGNLGSSEEQRRGAASYLDTSRRGRNETATHTGKKKKRKTLDFNILFPLYMR